MPVERVHPPGLFHSPFFWHIVKADNTIYVSGQVAQDEHGQVVGKGDFLAQATHAFENVKKALSAVGAGFDDVVKVTIYLTDPRYRDALRAVRAKYFTGLMPTSTLLVVAGLAEPEYLIEVEVVAVLSTS